MENQKALYPARVLPRAAPAITGLWQVSDRNDSAFAYRAVLDDELRTEPLVRDRHVDPETDGRRGASRTGY